MHTRSSWILRSASALVALALSVPTMGAQGRGAGAPQGDLLRQVRTAIAHGDLDEARRLADAGIGDDALKTVGKALIELFEGKDSEARDRLLPLATRTPLGEAALELGLLEVRTGRRDEGYRRLNALASVRTLTGPDDYMRLARAARGAREFLLANDAFVRVKDVPRADIQTEWGDMFLERHQPADAAASYQAALEADARWLPAMLGLAKALADDAPAESRRALAAAKAQAPGHPGVALAEAEQHLEANDVPAAKSALDRLATARPNTLDELAWRTAIAYKEGGVAAVEPAAARVRALIPTSSMGYRAASEQAARDYRFDDAALLARKAIEIDPDDATAQFDLGLALLRTGDEAAARTALETSWDLDKSAPVTKNLLTLLDHLDTFEVVSHNDFIFKFSKTEAPVLKTYALPLADQAYDEFTKRYGFKPKGPLLVEIFPVHDDFAVRTLGLPGLVGALGACFGRVVSMDSPNARPPGEFSWQATLWHELAHVFSLQLSEYRVPRWLTEGISVYEEHRRQAAWGRELTLEYARALSEGKTFGVKKLPDAFKHPESLSMAYFEASLVTEHLVAMNGEAGLRALLIAYAGGANDTEAFAKAFGKSVDQVETSFNAFIEQRYGALREAMKKPADVDANDLAGLRARAAAAPGNYVSQLALGLALVKAGDLQGAKGPLERAASLAPEASGDSSPRAVLARIYEQEKDLDGARRALRALLTFDHENVNAARKLATLANATKALDDENFALRLVADLDPFDADTHTTLGRRLLAKGESAPAAVEFQAALALGPTNLAEAHADLAEAWLKAGKFADARREALLSLEQAPTFSRAQDILLAVVGR